MFSVFRVTNGLIKLQFRIESVSSRSRQISATGLAESLLGRAMDLTLNILERAEDKLSENVHFYPLRLNYSALQNSHST